MKSFRLLLVTMLTLAGIGQVRAQEAYAVVTKNADSQPVSVTFYYDNNKSSFGTDVTVVEDLNATNVYKQWAGATLTSATFDSSFKNYTGLTSLYHGVQP